MAALWLDEIDAADLDTVGGKAASLGEMTGADLPVPPAFVVTAGTYRTFIEQAGIDEELFAAVDVDHENSDALAEAHQRARELIMNAPFPDGVEQEILDAYTGLGDDEPFVAVRSSATAEDLPDASFAGQQETFLNVQRGELLERVKECWASLFSQRAIYYRNRQEFAHRDVDIAVVVQLMVDADTSGVMFTSHPSTGAPQVTIEAAWGLGEAVVSGAVSPDNYEIDRETGDVQTVSVADKKTYMERDPETGETVEREVSDDRRERRVLDDAAISELVELGRTVESHYGEPQDVEWAIRDGTVYVLQSRPITTIADSASQPPDDTETEVATSGGVTVEESDDNDEVLVSGLGASPGVAAGTVRTVTKLDQLDKVADGDVIVTEMTMPDMVPAMKRAVAIVTDEGGMTSHAAIVSRELGVPAVVGTGAATHELSDGQTVTIDGEKGTVTEGDHSDTTTDDAETVDTAQPDTRVKPMTATEVKVNVSIPEAAQRAAATGADGVGLLRIEHVVLSLGKTPARYIADHGGEAYVQELVDGMQGVAEAFYPRPVRARTLDAPTDEFRELDGGADEPVEHNPMLGWRGVRRSLDKPDVFRHELEAFAQLYELGYDNVEMMFPLVNDPQEVEQVKRQLEDVGIDPTDRQWGVMIETPASALRIDELVETGIDFASFGTNDLTQYTLAVDRNNGNVADRFDELDPAVLELISQVIQTCRANDVATSICGQAGSKPRMVKFLVNEGITSISANIDAVRDVQQEVKRTEQQLILDSVR